MMPVRSAGAELGHLGLKMTEGGETTSRVCTWSWSCQAGWALRMLCSLLGPQAACRQDSLGAVLLGFV